MKKIKWICRNGECVFSTDDLGVFIDHLKEEHDIYINYEIEKISTSAKYQCKLCPEIFDTSTAKGKMHIAAKHGYSLKGAIDRGYAIKIEEGKTEDSNNEE